jgi:hypothetical protein
MARNKAMWILSGVLVISAWVLGSAVQARAEVMKCKTVLTATKDERIPVNDEAGHALGMQILQGLAFFENGTLAKVRAHAVFDFIPGKGSQVIAYQIYTFEDGATIVNRVQRFVVPDQSGHYSVKATGEIVKGTGRFEGIKGTVSSTGKNFSKESEEEAVRSVADFTWTYSLPTK